MKKKILLVVMVSMLFAGVVSAASIWGTYKGNQIIRITSNGTALKTPDVPAISYNNRTMIPISMLGQIGVGYTWDSKNQTVDVKVSQYSNSTSSNSADQKMKENVIIANNFKSLEDLGNTISLLANGYSLAYQSVDMNYKVYETLTDANSKLNSTIDMYNTTEKNLASPIYNNILNEYYRALESFKKTDVAIVKFANSKSKTDFDSYLNNSKDGSNTAALARFQAGQEYRKYIYSVINQ
ncbi:stalk domain-containing protein [Paenibacillus tundrae]